MPEQIIDLPRTSAAIKELATELVRYMKCEIKNTLPSRVQLDLSEHFSARQVLPRQRMRLQFHGLGCGSRNFYGISLLTFRSKACCSLRNLSTTPITTRSAEDFDKLLYSNAPLKLMMCRIETRYDTRRSGRTESTTDSGRSSGACPTELHELLRRRCRCCVLCVVGTSRREEPRFCIHATGRR